MNGSTIQDDPVQDVVFSFYNDQLFRIVVNYDSDRTLGLTDTDLIEALSAVWRSASANRREAESL